MIKITTTIMPPPVKNHPWFVVRTTEKDGDEVVHYLRSDGTWSKCCWDKSWQHHGYYATAQDAEAVLASSGETRYTVEP